MKLHAIAIALIVALTAGGCATRPDAGGGLAAASTLEGVAWSLIELDGRAVAAGNNSRHPTLRLDPATGRVTGYAGVNSYGGTFFLSGDTLGFGPIVSTKMAGAPEVMRLEQEFLAALAAAKTWQVRGDSLELKDGAGKAIARFLRAPEKA